VDRLKTTSSISDLIRNVASPRSGPESVAKPDNAQAARDAPVEAATRAAKVYLSVREKRPSQRAEKRN